MTHPYIHAQNTPDKAAYIMARSNTVVTYAELDAASNRAAQLFRSIGLQTGDHLALFSENNEQFLKLCWGAQRSGLYFTCIPSGLTADEAEYIIRDSGAKAVVVSAALAEAAARFAPRLADIELFAFGGAVDGFQSFESASETLPSTPIADEAAGVDMLYSSGTTGRPKGVKIAPPAERIDDLGGAFNFAEYLGVNSSSVYLSPAPLYHASPLRWTMGMHRYGGTAIVMEKFDAEFALELVERHKVTDSQWVPSMFVRLLKLPADVRSKYDLSSHRLAIHAAAPCPREVKQRMFEWWGPIIHEYYSGTEQCGLTYASPADWLAHPGTVGHPLVGALRILNEAGDVLPTGEEGMVYFAESRPFEYHGDPEKTAGAQNARGWVSLGDIGRLDEDGFLYLTDRKAFVIISGGVNIYPQELENLLVAHAKVADVAVIGAPNEDFGEEVKAVVQPMIWSDAGPALAEELMAYCRERLSKQKCPRSIDFDPALPRSETGKLYKRPIRDRYWPAATS